MRAFKKIPELDWLKELASQKLEEAADLRSMRRVKGVEEVEIVGKRLANLYRYLLWSQRYRLSGGAVPEGRVANAMVTKYYRKLFSMTLSKSMTDYEAKFIAEGEKMRKQLIAEAKKVKRGSA